MTDSRGQRPADSEYPLNSLRPGQRVRITRGPLRDLSGIVESTIDGSQVLIDAGEHAPGLSIYISSHVLEVLSE